MCLNKCGWGNMNIGGLPKSVPSKVSAFQRSDNVLPCLGPKLSFHSHTLCKPFSRWLLTQQPFFNFLHFLPTAPLANRSNRAVVSSDICIRAESGGPKHVS